MGGKTRHIPIRTCVACGAKEGKRALVRVVRTPEGRVEVDPTGKRPGRGAYLCPRRACWEKALKKGRLERALRSPLPPEVRETLVAYAQNLSAEPTPAGRVSGA